MNPVRGSGPVQARINSSLKKGTKVQSLQHVIPNAAPTGTDATSTAWIPGEVHLSLCKQGQIPHSNERKGSKLGHHFSTSFPIFFRNFFMLTSNSLFSHHLSTPCCCRMGQALKRCKSATTMAAIALTATRLAFPDKEDRMPDGSSLLPAQAAAEPVTLSFTNFSEPVVLSFKTLTLSFPSRPTSNLVNKNPACFAIHGQMECIASNFSHIFFE